MRTGEAALAEGRVTSCGTAINTFANLWVIYALLGFSLPIGIVPQHGWGAGFVAAAVLPTVAAGLTSVMSVFAHRRGANAEHRKQLKWLGYVGDVGVDKRTS